MLNGGRVVYLCSHPPLALHDVHFGSLADIQPASAMSPLLPLEEPAEWVSAKCEDQTRGAVRNALATSLSANSYDPIELTQKSEGNLYDEQYDSDQ